MKNKYLIKSEVRSVRCQVNGVNQPDTWHVTPDTEFMTDILNKTIVLVLNRNWQAINVRMLHRCSLLLSRLKARFVIQDADTTQASGGRIT